MSEGDIRRPWTRHLFHRKEVVRPTWLFRCVILGTVLCAVAAGFAYWVPGLGRRLICESMAATGDVILIDNLDQNYLVFERAAELRRDGVAPRVLVAISGYSYPLQPNIVSAGIVQVMSRVAQLEQPELIPVQEIEPITLNVAYQIREHLERARVRSVVVLAPAFRSRRSLLIYSTVFADAGIRTSCIPVFGQEDPDSWTRTWHGIQQVAEQFAKLQYYRFYVMPYLVRSPGSAS